MLVRYYALTKGVRLNDVNSYESGDDRDHETFHYLKWHTQEKIKDLAIQDAEKLLSKSQEEIILFTTLEEAQQFAKENIYYHGFDYTYGPQGAIPQNQKAVVEIYVDPSKTQLKKINSDSLNKKIDTEFDFGSWDRAVREKYNNFRICERSSHQCFLMANQPANYVINKVWAPSLYPFKETSDYQNWEHKLKSWRRPVENLEEKQQVVDLHQQAPEGCKDFFKDEKATLKGISDMFQEYHSPAFFSCHWRHHKNLAEQITHALSRLGDNKRKVYEFLFKERQRLLTSNANINLTGTLMQRIDFSLKKLRDQYGQEINPEPVIDLSVKGLAKSNTSESKADGKINQQEVKDSHRVMKNVLDIFTEYHSPSFFSCHWRHHKDLARKITADLKLENDVSKVHEYLSYEKERLLLMDKNINKKGTFMRKINSALELLKGNLQQGEIPVLKNTPAGTF